MIWAFPQTYADRGVFVLCRTSNPSAPDVQDAQVDGGPLYEHVARRAVEWNEHGNCGLVVGATYPAEIERVLLMSNGGIVAEGPKEHMLQPERLEEIFGTKIEMTQYNGYYHLW